MTTAYRIEGDPKPPFVAGADLSGHQFRFVKVGPVESQVVPIANKNDRPVAVLMDRPVAGQAGDFVAIGIVEVVAGAAIAYGAEIATDPTGRAVPVTSGQYICGYALTAAPAAGARFSAFVNLAAHPRLP